MCVGDGGRLALERAVTGECGLHGRQVCRCAHTLSVNNGVGWVCALVGLSASI
jgi:hypothetical protein